MNVTPLVVAHRGFTREHTENTIPALAAAVALGVDMVEFDVHETSDHEFVVFHDARPMQSAPLWSSIASTETTKYTRDAARPPLLSEWIRAMGNLPGYLELKRILHPSCLSTYLKKNPLPPRSLIGSNDKQLLEDLHAEGVAYPLLFSVRPLPPFAPKVVGGILLGMAPKGARWNFLAGFSIHRSVATRRFIASLTTHGKQAYVWTVNQEGRMKELAEQGVNAIITDRPDALLRTQGRASSRE